MNYVHICTYVSVLMYYVMYNYATISILGKVHSCQSRFSYLFPIHEGIGAKVVIATFTAFTGDLRRLLACGLRHGAATASSYRSL